MKSLNTSVVAILVALIAILIATPALADITPATESMGGKFSFWGGLANSDGVEIEAPSDYSTNILTGQVKSQFAFGINYAVVTDKFILGLTGKNGKNSAFGAPDPINWGGDEGLYQVKLSKTVLLAEAAVQTSWFKISSSPEWGWMRFQALAGGHLDLTGRNITLERYDDNEHGFSEEIANIRMHDYSISLRTGTGTKEIGMIWLGVTLGRKIFSVSYTGGYDYLDIRSKGLTTFSVSLGISR